MDRWPWFVAYVAPGLAAAVALWFAGARRSAISVAGFAVLSVMLVSAWLSSELSRLIVGDAPGLILAPLLPMAPNLVLLLNLPALLAIRFGRQWLAFALVGVGGSIGAGLAYIYAPLVAVAWAVSLWIALRTNGTSVRPA